VFYRVSTRLFPWLLNNILRDPGANSRSSTNKSPNTVVYAQNKNSGVYAQGNTNNIGRGNRKGKTSMQTSTRESNQVFSHTASPSDLNTLPDNPVLRSLKTQATVPFRPATRITWVRATRKANSSLTRATQPQRETRLCTQTRATLATAIKEVITPMETITRATI